MRLLQIFSLATLATLAACGPPPPARPVAVNTGALPLGPTRQLIDIQGNKVPCTVAGGGMCLQRE